ncbi:MAG: hypothetical protein R2911_23590 [Caldilineaceae bacterium]
MTAQHSPAWMAGLHAGLVQRLAQPLQQPGLVNFAHSHVVLARSRQMLPNLPLSDALLARWGQRQLAGGASAAEPLPIVHVQAPASARGAHTGLTYPQSSSADASNAARPVVKPKSTQPAAVDRPSSAGSKAAAPPIVAAAPQPTSDATLPSASKPISASATPDNLLRAAVASTGSTLPAPAAASFQREDSPPAMRVASAQRRDNEAIAPSPQPLTVASTAVNPSIADQAGSKPSAGSADGVIQRIPAGKVIPPRPLAQSIESPSTERSTPRGVAPQSQPGQSPSSVMPAGDAVTVRPTMQRAAAMSAAPPPLHRAAQSVVSQKATAQANSNSLPVVRALPTSTFTPENNRLVTKPQATASADSAPTPSAPRPVVQARAPQQNGVRANSLPLRTASPAPSSSTNGVIQRTALPGAQKGSTPPAVRGGGVRRRAVGVNTPPVIQRTPAAVNQRVDAGAELDEAEQTYELDLETIVDRVQRQFMRRLEVESERRGGAAWR